MKLISILYHPTTTTIIDDDPSLLNNLALSLSAHFKCKTFSSAIEGKAALIKGYEKLGQNKYHNASYDDLIDISIDLKISEVYKEIYNNERFSPSVVVILDYEMPDMNGLTLARELKEQMPNIKIIMFTGEATHEIATSGFNKNEIDRFIQKNMANYEEKLISYIDELTLDFFTQTFAGVLDYIKNRKDHPLQDPDFINTFNQIGKENNIVEYYLLDESGSFLMLDKAGEPTWLIVRTEEDMRTCYELAEGDHASDDILESINKKEKIAIFSDENSLSLPLEEWHFYPAQKIKNKNIYYCILKQNEFSLHLKNLKSYKKFLLSE